MLLKNKNRAGFTLLETILTLLIMGFLTLGVYLMPGGIGDMTQGFSLETQAKLIESELRYIQSRARTTGHLHGMKINNDHQYDLYEQDDLGAVTIVDSPQTQEPMSIDISDKHLRFDFVNFPQEVKFKGSVGAPSTGEGLDIVITTGTDTKTISVTDITGRIEIIN